MYSMHLIRILTVLGSFMCSLLLLNDDVRLFTINDAIFSSPTISYLIRSLSLLLNEKGLGVEIELSSKTMHHVS